MDFSVRAAQSAALSKALAPSPGLLSSAAEAPPAGANGPDEAVRDTPWHVLVYDDFCRNALSPLLRVGNLRKLGVTLFLPLHATRQSIPGVPCVFLVKANQANVDRISQDLAQNLYDSCVINFVPSVPRPLLESLAEQAAASDSVPLVRAVRDTHLSFISLEDDLFELQMSNAYSVFNDPSLSEEVANSAIDECASGLFSVLATLKVVPIVRCAKGSGGVGEAVAMRLHEMLVDELRSELSFGGGGGSVSSADDGALGGLFLGERGTSAAAVTALQHSAERPLLVISDRNAAGVGVLLRHAWTYQALAHDLLGLDLNKVKLDAKKDATGTAQSESEICDLDSSTDAFWRANAMKAFPEIAVGVKEAIAEYQKSLDEFQRLSQGTGLSSDDVARLADGKAPEHAPSAATGSQGKTANLHAFVASVPALRNQKRQIDVHTNVATSILGHIKRRGIDALVALEEPASTGQKALTAADILPVLQDSCEDMTDGASASYRDKLRLFVLLLVQSVTRDGGASVSQTEMDACEAAIKRALSAEQQDSDELERVLKFVRHLRGILRLQKQYTQQQHQHKQHSTHSQDQTMGSLVSKLGGFNIAQALTGQQNDLTSATRNQLSQLFSAGVRAFMPSTSSKLPLTSLIELLMANKKAPPGSTTEDPVESFMYLDSLHSARSGQSSTGGQDSLRKRTTPFRNAIAFVVGGGNFVEYHNLHTQINQSSAQGAESHAPSGAALSSSASRVIYGATDLPTGEQFLTQLSTLGGKLV